jgi:hypothetical protein
MRNGEEKQEPERKAEFRIQNDKAETTSTDSVFFSF